VEALDAVVPDGVMKSAYSSRQTQQSNITTLTARPSETFWKIGLTNLKQLGQCPGTRWKDAPHPPYKHQLGSVGCMLLRANNWTA